MKDNIYNLFDYIKWWGEITLDQLALNDVDALALTQLAYMYLDKAFAVQSNLSIQEAMLSTDNKRFEGDEFALERHRFVMELSNAARFKDLVIHDYVNEIDISTQLQFAALSIKLADDLEFVAYRGTGDELVGWREDFNLTFLSPIPAQQHAAGYLNQRYADNHSSIVLGGHSKGGNLAMYAAIQCDLSIQDRIQMVYNFDGPGFGKESENSKKIEALAHKLRSFLPKNGVVGILLAGNADHIIVDSSSTGIFQHNALTWSVLGSRFVETQRNESSIQFEKDLNQCLASVDDKTCQEIITVFFDALESSGVRYLSDLTKNINVPKVLNDAAKTLSKEHKKWIESLIKAAIDYSISSVGESIKESKLVEFVTNMFSSNS